MMVAETTEGDIILKQCGNEECGRWFGTVDEEQEFCNFCIVEGYRRNGVEMPHE